MTIETIREKLKGHPGMVEQLPILQKCITTRWEILAVEAEAKVPECQLCEAYGGHEDCGDCVIKQATGRRQCIGTNYYEWTGTFSQTDKKKQAKIMLQELQDIETVLIEMKG